MAHIAVLLQRTPHGLHPASAVALCWARDIASARGASVTALCRGDAGEADQRLVTAAGRFGADVILFGGPNGLAHLRERLNPVHVLVPHTPMGLRVVEEALGDGAHEQPIPRWIDRRSPPFSTADAFTAVVAGVQPWHHFDTELDPEYEGDVDTAELPSFMRPTNNEADETPVATPPCFTLGAQPLGYIAPDSLDPKVVESLQGLGAHATSWDEAPHRSGGTTLVLLEGQDSEPAPLPAAAYAPAPRTDRGRLLALTGPGTASTPEVPTSWLHADLVLPGRFKDVVASLREGVWTRPS